MHEAIEDFYIGIANSYSYNDRRDRRETLLEAWDEYREALSLNREIYHARLDNDVLPVRREHVHFPSPTFFTKHAFKAIAIPSILQSIS